MARFPFRTMRKHFAPRWITEGEGGLIGEALDVLKDAFASRAELALLVRFPQQGPDGTPAPIDALVAMGRDRGLVRGISETLADYAERLKGWLTDRATIGNPFTMLRQIAAYTGPGFAFRTVDVRGNWYSRAADGTETTSLDSGTWNWDGDTGAWSRFWVIIYPDTAVWNASARTWGSGSWGTDAGTWGTTITPEQSANLRDIVEAWKPAGTLANIILAPDPTSFDPTAPEPDGSWRAFYKYSAGVAVPARLSTARYLGA
jgi:hypothetical protein